MRDIYETGNGEKKQFPVDKKNNFLIIFYFSSFMELFFEKLLFDIFQPTSFYKFLQVSVSGIFWKSPKMSGKCPGASPGVPRMSGRCPGKVPGTF